MHILKGKERTTLGINTLPAPVRVYIAELELELDRVTTRQARLRQNIRSMQRKLAYYNLKEEIEQLTKMLEEEHQKLIEAVA